MTKPNKRISLENDAKHNLYLKINPYTLKLTNVDALFVFLLSEDGLLASRGITSCIDFIALNTKETVDHQQYRNILSYLMNLRQVFEEIELTIPPS